MDPSLLTLDTLHNIPFHTFSISLANGHLRTLHSAQLLTAHIHPHYDASIATQLKLAFARRRLRSQVKQAAPSIDEVHSLEHPDLHRLSTEELSGYSSAQLALVFHHPEATDDDKAVAEAEFLTRRERDELRMLRDRAGFGVKHPPPLHTQRGMTPTDIGRFSTQPESLRPRCQSFALEQSVEQTAKLNLDDTAMRISPQLTSLATAPITTPSSIAPRSATASQGFIEAQQSASLRAPSLAHQPVDRHPSLPPTPTFLTASQPVAQHSDAIARQIAALPPRPQSDATPRKPSLTLTAATPNDANPEAAAMRTSAIQLPPSSPNILVKEEPLTWQLDVNGTMKNVSVNEYINEIERRKLAAKAFKPKRSSLPNPKPLKETIVPKVAPDPTVQATPDHPRTTDPSPSAEATACAGVDPGPSQDVDMAAPVQPSSNSARTTDPPPLKINTQTDAQPHHINRDPPKSAPIRAAPPSSTRSGNRWTSQNPPADERRSYALPTQPRVARLPPARGDRSRKSYSPPLPRRRFASPGYTRPRSPRRAYSPTRHASRGRRTRSPSSDREYASRRRRSSSRRYSPRRSSSSRSRSRSPRHGARYNNSYASYRRSISPNFDSRARNAGRSDRPRVNGRSRSPVEQTQPINSIKTTAGVGNTNASDVNVPLHKTAAKPANAATADNATTVAVAAAVMIPASIPPQAAVTEAPANTGLRPQVESSTAQQPGEANTATKSKSPSLPSQRNREATVSVQSLAAKQLEAAKLKCQKYKVPNLAVGKVLTNLPASNAESSQLNFVEIPDSPDDDLPAPWVVKHSRKDPNEVFYYNPESRAATWCKPNSEARSASVLDASSDGEPMDEGTPPVSAVTDYPEVPWAALDNFQPCLLEFVPLPLKDRIAVGTILACGDTLDAPLVLKADEVEHCYIAWYYSDKIAQGAFQRIRQEVSNLVKGLKTISHDEAKQWCRGGLTWQDVRRDALGGRGRGWDLEVPGRDSSRWRSLIVSVNESLQQQQQGLSKHASHEGSGGGFNNNMKSLSSRISGSNVTTTSMSHDVGSTNQVNHLTSCTPTSLLGMTVSTAIPISQDLVDRVSHATQTPSTTTTMVASTLKKRRLSNSFGVDQVSLRERINKIPPPQTGPSSSHSLLNRVDGVQPRWPR